MVVLIFLWSIIISSINLVFCIQHLFEGMNLKERKHTGLWGEILFLLTRHISILISNPPPSSCCQVVGLALVEDWLQKYFQILFLSPVPALCSHQEGFLFPSEIRWTLVEHKNLLPPRPQLVRKRNVFSGVELRFGGCFLHSIIVAIEDQHSS